MKRLQQTRQSEEAVKESIAAKALARWASMTTRSAMQFEEAMAAHDAHLLKMSKGFSRAYAINIFQLNSVSLKNRFRL